MMNIMIRDLKLQHLKCGKAHATKSEWTTTRSIISDSSRVYHPLQV